MTSLYATTSRLIDERLAALLSASQLFDGRIDDSGAQFARLAGAGLALARRPDHELTRHGLARSIPSEPSAAAQGHQRRPLARRRDGGLV